VGRGVGRARVAKEKERKWGKGGGCGGDRFYSTRHVGDGLWGGATLQARAERGGEREGGQVQRGTARASSRPAAARAGGAFYLSRGKEAPGQ
jgi:hypothetical protein